MQNLSISSNGIKITGDTCFYLLEFTNMPDLQFVADCSQFGCV